MKSVTELMDALAGHWRRSGLEVRRAALFLPIDGFDTEIELHNALLTGETLAYFELVVQDATATGCVYFANLSLAGARRFLRN